MNSSITSIRPGALFFPTLMKDTICLFEGSLLHRIGLLTACIYPSIIISNQINRRVFPVPIENEKSEKISKTIVNSMPFRQVPSGFYQILLLPGVVIGSVVSSAIEGIAFLLQNTVTKVFESLEESNKEKKIEWKHRLIRLLSDLFVGIVLAKRLEGTVQAGMALGILSFISDHFLKAAACSLIKEENKMRTLITGKNMTSIFSAIVLFSGKDLPTTES